MLNRLLGRNNGLTVNVILLCSMLAGGSLNTYAKGRVYECSKVECAILAKSILADQQIIKVYSFAEKLMENGLNAGSLYQEVWIRDLNTFIELALHMGYQDDIRQALLIFFHFQDKEGGVVDGYIPLEDAAHDYNYIYSASKPDLMAYKNTVETDQESSLIQAVYKYVDYTKDYSILDETIEGLTVKERLYQAVNFLIENRYSEKYKLIWGATTADWGDVQPEHEWGVELNADSHKAIDIYDNAMLIIALDNLIQLSPQSVKIKNITLIMLRDDLRERTRRFLWDSYLEKFRPHIYLDKSPFPVEFEEQLVYYHGGTAVAMEAGILTRDDVLVSFKDMVHNKNRVGAGSIGLTLYPSYPANTFKNPQMGPYSYQNGGDWTWFGARIIRQLINYGYVKEAYIELRPMLNRVIHHQGFYEWYSVDNKPHGSGAFKGSAGVLASTILALKEWANLQTTDHEVEFE